jgi:alpha-1,2-mannosyltransferase
MWYLLKRLFLVILLIIWGLTLINLILLSAFTFFLVNICLTIFLFWLIPTLIAWSIALIPIIKYVFIPWHRRQCRLWTINEQESRLSVAFFHPYCHNGSGIERVLWTAVESILNKYQNDIQIIIYTGDIDVTPEEILHRVKQRFDIDLEDYKNSITFIYLQSRVLMEAKHYKILTTLGQNIGSIIVGFEAMIRFIPDIYIDSMGYAFTYPCFYYLASVPIVSYVHYPTISSGQVEQVNERYTTYNKHQLITNSSLLGSKIQLLYYQIFTSIYGWCGRCSKIVYCNSSRTKKHIESIWGSACIHLVHPPCDIKQFLEMPKDEHMTKTIVSIGQFRLEKNHELQIRAFHQLLQRYIK